jgi:serine/threonine-protein kinase
MREGTRHLFWQPANAAGTAERIVDGNRTMIVAYTLSPEGNRLLFRGARQASSDLMFVDLGGPRGELPSVDVADPQPLVQTSFEEVNAQISADGRWLAYQSNSSGVFEIYVRPFPDIESGQWLVSTAGGSEPIWARSGRDLFNRALDGAVMSVAVPPAGTWAPGAPRRLFDGTSYALSAEGEAIPSLARTYDVSPDGRRFLMLKTVNQPAQTAARIVFVENWNEELERLVPAN